MVLAVQARWPTLVARVSREARDATCSELRQRLGAGAHADKGSRNPCGHTHVLRQISIASPNSGRPIRLVIHVSGGLPAYDDEHLNKHFIENGSSHARYAVAKHPPRRLAS